MPHQWTKTQMHRAYLLFQLYPSIEQAYHFYRDFKNIYKLEDLHKAKTALAEWIKRAQDSRIEYFQSVAETLIAHWERIVAFFANRSTNAHAESLNAQIKLYRSNLRGVTDSKFFVSLKNSYLSYFWNQEKSAEPSC